MQGIVIAGTHSGCGKTTITLGMLAALRKKGLRVQPFKAGPDFIDTGLHGLVTGRTSRNLDLWMCGRDYVLECYRRNSADADISVVEGVMGMYDGNLSTADLAAALNIPVVLVVDSFGMAESAGAVVKGFKEYRVQSSELPPHPPLGKGGASKLHTPDSQLLWAGVIFNRVASERHFKRLKESVRDVPVLGYLPREIGFNIPHRHLGLMTAEEQPLAAEEIDRLADAVLEHIDVEQIVRKTNPPLPKGRINTELRTPVSKLRIGVASDKAFCFYYEDNLDLLRQEGAEIVKFSPLTDSAVPDNIDALYIGGGYPELYAAQLSANGSMLDSIRGFAYEGGPVYAECGGFMYLTQGIYDTENSYHPMAGVFPFRTRMMKGRARLGYREAVLKEDCMLGKEGDTVRGHEFHYSEIVDSGEARKLGSRGEVPSPFQMVYSVRDGCGTHIYDEGFRVKNTFGSYIHVHFGSNQLTAKNIIGFIREKYGKNSNCGTR